MRSNIVSEAGFPTRFKQWWEGIPFLTSVVVAVCAVIYLVCLLVGYDSFAEVCFWPSAVISKFQVYRVFTSIFFHGSILHLVFNMLALVPLGSELERVMGSIRLLYMIVLLATSSAIFHLLITLIAAYNPIHSYYHFMDECAIGFSGVLFSMIVIETSLNGVQSRSVFGLFNVPAKLYPWILLVVFQLLMTNISLLGHLCGILSGFAYTYGLFNFIIPGSSFYSGIESSSWLSTCVRRPKYIMCTGGEPSGYIPTYSTRNTASSESLSGNMWSNLSSWMPRREVPSQSTEESSRFPGRGRTLGAPQMETVSNNSSDSSLQARLLETPVRPSTQEPIGAGQQRNDRRQPGIDNTAAATMGSPVSQVTVASDEDIQKLLAMGFDKTQVEVAIAAADGDVNVAVEILMSQQVSI
ncbi:rhomboid-like protein 15 isoform X1 [Cynara cardunculus var. scolymus]|uniref:rhomboid-like protein 15 isoform X1 n=2 Tax=Cynara cardunculus var. scolymus TaxID=59895 RepID=UPI000D6307E6|nr:rhomboid-like protein 15 isoform X1 [Cynara cardunculus var. scolymus]